MIALAIAFATALLAQAWRTSHATTPMRYSTASVARGSIARTVTASGSVNPVITIQVGTYVSGVIQQLYCDYNTIVRKGQLCARIDPRPYQVVVDQDRANLSIANAQLAKDRTSLGLAKLTYDRTVDLCARGIVSQDTLDAAKSAHDEAAAQVELDLSTVEQRQAALNAAEINLDYTRIVSPVSGTVVSRSVTVGQTVAASFQTPTLFLIATDLTKMQVDANVSESDIGGVAAGNRATFTVEAFPSHSFNGLVEQVRQAPQTVQNVVTYDVVIGVENPELLLKPGMTATVRIVTKRRDDVLRVPEPALRYTPGGVNSAAGRSGQGTRGGESACVWVLRGGRPVAVPVGIGLDDDNFAEITSGALKTGDEVIIGEQTGIPTPASRLPFFRL
jgi:HlyD family secretion protein